MFTQPSAAALNLRCHYVARYDFDINHVEEMAAAAEVLGCQPLADRCAQKTGRSYCGIVCGLLSHTIEKMDINNRHTVLFHWFAKSRPISNADAS